jgi:hypothetical protein
MFSLLSHLTILTVSAAAVWVSIFQINEICTVLDFHGATELRASFRNPSESFELRTGNLVITNVVPDSHAEKHGIVSGARILGVRTGNNKMEQKPEAMQKVLQKAKADDEIQISFGKPGFNDFRD